MNRLTLLVVGLALVSSGCLRRFVATESRYLLASRYVFDRPVEEVWPAVREVLKEDGFSLRESEKSFEIVSEWREETASSWHLGTRSRYLVLAERLEADRCIIRFVRVSTLPPGTDDYQRMGPRAFTKMAVDGRRNLSREGAYGSYAGGTMARRDLKMEWKVLEKVRPDIAAQSDAEIERHLPDWLGEDPEAVKLRPAAKKLSGPRVASASASVEARATVEELLPAQGLPTDTPGSPVVAGPTEHSVEELGPAPGSESAQRACDRALFGEETTFRPGKILLMGETPGTREIPRYVGQVACRAARAGGTVVVALEIPFDEQPRLDRFLASEGTDADRALLLKGGFWHRAWQDGRSSLAVLELIDQARALRREGRAISVLAFDVRGLGGNARQHQLASRIAAARDASPEALMLVLTGNVQARIVTGAEWDSQLAPMGARLVAARYDVVSLDAHYSGGAAWTCRLSQASQTECAEGFLPAPQRSRILGRGMGSNKEATGLQRHSTYVSLDPEAAGGAHHGLFYLGKLSASPPAVSDPKAWTVVR